MAPLDSYSVAFSIFDACTDARVALGFDEAGELAAYGDDFPDALRARLRRLVGEGDTRTGVDSYRALRAILRAPDRACRELLTLPVALARLPLPYAATFARKRARAVFATSQALYLQAVKQGLPAFVLREVDAAARAFDAGRATPAQLDRWLAAKGRGAAWVLTPEIADAPRTAPGDTPAPPTCTFGALFDGLGAELVGVEVDEVALQVRVA